MCAALYTPPPRSTSDMIAASMLHFCASSFCVSFFSQRATLIVSDVALLTYFVFFMSSSDAALYTPTFSNEDAVVTGLFAVVAAVRLLNVTGVQSWQSGTLDMRDIRSNNS